MPGFERHEADRPGGRFTGGPAKLCIHSTEGHSIEAAIGAYYSHGGWPGWTVDMAPQVRRRVQHYDSAVASRALRHPAGTPHTNNDDVAQIELVGFAGQMHLRSRAELEWFGAEVVGPICRDRNIKLEAVVFYGEDAGWTLAVEDAPQRMSWAEFDSYNAVFGHQHAPGNTHWDPGKLDIAVILAAAGGQKPTDLVDLIRRTTPPEEEDRMTRLLRVDNQPGPAIIVRDTAKGGTTAQQVPTEAEWKRLRYVPLWRPGGIPEIAVSREEFDRHVAMARATGGYYRWNPATKGFDLVSDAA